MSSVCDPIVNKPKPKVEAPPAPKEGEKNGAEGDTAKADASQPETQSTEQSAEQTNTPGNSQPPPTNGAATNTQVPVDMDVD